MPIKPTTTQDCAFDRLTSLAMAMFDAPTAMASVVEDQQTLFRSHLGFEQTEMRRELTISHLLVSMGAGATLIVEDGLADPRTCDHPLVTGAPFLRWFAGMTISDASGRPVGAIGVMDTKPRPAPTPAQMEHLAMLAQLAGDIVDRANEARLREDQVRMLKLAEEMSGVGHWRWDIASNQIEWSDEVYRIHGLDPATFTPTLEGMAVYYGDEDRVELKRLIARAVQEGEDYQFRLPLTRPDGEVRWVVAKGVTSRDPDTGKVASIFGLLQDVTEQTETLKRVSTSEARYRLLADRATDIIATYDFEGVFTYISPAIETALGYRPDELVGRRFEDFMHPEDRAATRDAFAAYVTAGPEATPPRVRYRCLTRGGELAWLEAHPRAIRDADGRIVEFQDQVRVVTGTKLLEDQLMAARDRAETAARSQSAFLANMSHELRTPLTSVIGFSGLLKQSQSLGPEERRHVDRIGVGSEALLSVINDILDYSKLEAGAVEVDPQPFDPRALAAGVGDLIAAQAEAAGLSVSIDVADAVPAGLMGDEGRLRQVLLNFMGNAVKFTASGGVSLTLDATTADDGQTWIAASVTDTGIGITSETAAHLFERFVQADLSTTRTYGGTGLGLAISRQLIEMMGGEVGAHGVPGVGSTFWFRVPLSAVEAQAAKDRAEETASMKTARILVADDAPANRELVSAILGGLGLEVTTVDNGVEAVAAARQGGFDLILMDVHMPVMDGLDATRAIRADGGAVGRIPILALTANVEREQVQRCLEAGMNGHLGKPIAVDKLVAALTSWLCDDEVVAAAG